MSKNYVDYMVEETKNILAIDSPSGFTKEVADYVMGEYKKLGYEPKLTVKGGVLVPIGGRDKENTVFHAWKHKTITPIFTTFFSEHNLIDTRL